MVLGGIDTDDIEVGQVIVYRTNRPDPIIHRVIHVYQEDGKRFFQTKGDHNVASNFDEKKIAGEQVIGRALFRVPVLGWIKITAVCVLEGVQAGFKFPSAFAKCMVR